MKIAITGHRPNKIGDYDLKDEIWSKIRHRIVDVLLTIPAESDLTLITGMALGIDTLFAKIAIDNALPFIAAIPCLNQDSKWIPRSQQLYKELISNPLCTQHYVSNKPYDNICMQRRNEWMVNECDLLIAVWDNSSGGTANCVRYARLNGFVEGENLFIINPKNL